MGGMANLFKKLIPFIMIICLVTFGISVIFPQKNITYLSTQTINGVTQYKFDFVTYVKNISFKNLQSAVTNVIDIKTLQNVIKSFNDIWKTGYKIGNVTKTGIAVVVLILDIVITALNMILVPIRLIAGLLLTALNLLGINITNNNNPIVYLLNGLVKLYRTQNGSMVPLIPLIPYEAGSDPIKIVTTVPIY